MLISFFTNFFNKQKSDNEIITEIRELFYKSKLKECIQKVDQFKNSQQQLDFTVYQTIEFYKCQSYFKLSNIPQGIACIQKLIKLSNEQKGDKVDEIDILIQSEYQMQTVDIDQSTAIQQNKTILDCTLKYQQQNEKDVHFNKGFYLLGLGVFNFVEQLDQDDKDLECLAQLQQSYETVVSFKQEIGYICGCVIFYLAKYDKQLPFCKQLYELNPNFPDMAGLVALSYKLLEKYEEAEKYYKIAQQLCPENTITLVNASLLYNKQQQKEKELECLKKAYNFSPKSGRVSKHYGKYLIQNDEREKGLKIIADGMKNEPSYFNLFSYFAQIQFEKQNFQYGLQILEEFVNKNPNNLDGLFEIIKNLRQYQQYDKALEYIQKYLNLDKRDSIYSQTVKLFYSSCLYYQQFEEESLQEFLKLLNYSKIQIWRQNLIIWINHILNNPEIISQQKQINIISDLYGPIQMRLNLLMEGEEGVKKPDILKVLIQKQDIFREILQILAYKYQIQQYLSFQSSISHWDLFIN